MENEPAVQSRKKCASLKRYTQCLEGKQNRVRFKSSPPSRKSSILDIVHSDVCSPINTRSLGRSLNFVTFIDDNSMKL